MKQEGLILVNTGMGKGKSTAAFGTVLRAVGRGLRVLVVQFIKSGKGYGEYMGLQKLGVPVKAVGEGFVFFNKEGTPEELAMHKKAAQDGWHMVEQEINSHNWDLIVLDEVNVAMHYGLLTVDEVVQAIQQKPKELHIIATGRYAPQELIDIAHTVTDMTEVKHAYKQGIMAAKGIEF